MFVFLHQSFSNFDLFCNLQGSHPKHEKTDRELRKVNEESENPSTDAMEIDLKCAEKVTDSDVESNADDKVKTAFKVD
jgi:hypothetical protein